MAVLPASQRFSMRILAPCRRALVHSRTNVVLPTRRPSLSSFVRRQWHSTKVPPTKTPAAAKQPSAPPPTPQQQSPNQTRLYSFGIGTTAGCFGALAGMGGGFVMIPLLTGVLGVSQHVAHGTSLVAVVTTGVAGAWSYRDFVDVEAATWVAGAGLVTARAGALFTKGLSQTALARGLGVLLLCLAPVVPLKSSITNWIEQRQQQTMSLASNQDTNETTPENDRGTSDSTSTLDTVATKSTRERVSMIGIGLTSGFLAGVFGVGGGTLVVPALAVVGDKTHLEALATSLAAMMGPALVGSYTHWTVGHVASPRLIAGPLCLGALVGATVGGALGQVLPEHVMRTGFGILLAGLGIRTLRKTF